MNKLILLTASMSPTGNFCDITGLIAADNFETQETLISGCDCDESFRHAAAWLLNSSDPLFHHATSSGQNKCGHTNNASLYGESSKWFGRDFRFPIWIFMFSHNLLLINDKNTKQATVMSS